MMHITRPRPLRNRHATVSAEDAEFRKWVQSNSPSWELVWDRPHPRHRDEPATVGTLQSRATVCPSHGPCLGVQHPAQAATRNRGRRHNIAAATEQLTALHQRLINARARLRGAAQIDLRVAEILEHSM